MKTYLDKWVELSPSDASYAGLRDLIVKEQVLDALPKELSIYLHERDPDNLQELSKLATQYMKAHNKELHQEKIDNKKKETQQMN